MCICTEIPLLIRTLWGCVCKEQYIHPFMISHARIFFHKVTMKCPVKGQILVVFEYFFLIFPATSLVKKEMKFLWCNFSQWTHAGFMSLWLPYRRELCRSQNLVTYHWLEFHAHWYSCPFLLPNFLLAYKLHLISLSGTWEFTYTFYFISGCLLLT